MESLKLANLITYAGKHFLHRFTQNLENNHMKYFCLVCIILLSCQSKKDSETSFLDFPRHRPLTAERLKLPDQINQAFEIYFIGKNLILTSETNGYLFQVYALENNQLVDQFGSVGQGPCEFEFPTSLQVLHASNPPIQLGLFNRRHFSFQRLDAESFDCITERIGPLDFNFQQVIHLTDSVYFGIGIFPNKYAIYTVETNETEVLSIPYPFQNGKLHVESSIAMHQQGDIHLKPDGSKILVTSTFSPFFDILTAQDFQIVKRMEGWASLPIKSDDPNMLTSALNKANKFGFISSAVTDQYIYLLFSGKTTGNNPYSSKVIHVYDWEGTKLEQLNLSREVEKITVSAQDTTIYAYYDDGKANLLKFKLN